MRDGKQTLTQQPTAVNSDEGTRELHAKRCEPDVEAVKSENKFTLQKKVEVKRTGT